MSDGMSETTSPAGLLARFTRPGPARAAAGFALEP